MTNNVPTVPPPQIEQPDLSDNRERVRRVAASIRRPIPGEAITTVGDPLPENFKIYVRSLYAMTKDELVRYHLQYMRNKGLQRVVDKELHRRGVEEKKKRDPKQAAKRKVKETWEKWHSGELRFKSDADFARKMNSKFPILVDVKNIAKWSSNWRKKANWQG